MKMIPARKCTELEIKMQSELEANAPLKWEITRLLNSYRELVRSIGQTDIADIVKTCAKNETTMIRLDIPLLNTPEEWLAWYERKVTYL